MALRPNKPESRSEQLAARDAAQQDVFLREVDDALRQDEMLGLYRRYGKPVLALVILGLVGLAGYLWWDHRQTEAAGKRSEALVVALDQVEAGNLAAADKQLATIAEGEGTGSIAAARLMRAGIALEQGRPQDAIKLYAQIATDESSPQAYRDLATIREVALRFDYLPPQEVVDRLKPLAAPGGPWSGIAGELVGIAYLKQGRNDLAGPLFARIARDKDTPETLRRRVRQLAGLLGVDAIDDAEAAKLAVEGDAQEAAASGQQ